MMRKKNMIKEEAPIALVDCNNFFVSCERVFQPDLRDVPVAVLSGKDGCVIARSNEVKALGIGMGEPIFRYKRLVREHNIAIRTTNFALYSDLSKRVMATLKEHSPRVEQYSIDEAFCDVDEKNIDADAMAIKDMIYQHVGIPVSVGVATTKTLAKIATGRAKKHDESNSVGNMYDMTEDEQDSILKNVDVSDVWGIGRGHTGTFRSHGIMTAYDVKYADPLWARGVCGIGIAHTIQEVRGHVMLPYGQRHKPPQSIMCTRSFRGAITTKQHLAEMLALYVTRASEKLRKNGLQAGRIAILVRSGHFARDMQYSKQVSRELEVPTAYTPTLIAHAKELLDDIYVEGVAYKKAGISLSQLSSYEHEQLTFLTQASAYSSAQKSVMRAQDVINRKYGKDTIASAALGPEAQWVLPQSQRSHRFTTQWDELLRINI